MANERIAIVRAFKRDIRWDIDDKPIEEVIEVLRRVSKEISEKGATDIALTIDSSYEDSVEINITGNRMETQAEADLRVEAEVVNKERQKAFLRQRLAELEKA